MAEPSPAQDDTAAADSNNNNIVESVPCDRCGEHFMHNVLLRHMSQCHSKARVEGAVVGGAQNAVRKMSASGGTSEGRSCPSCKAVEYCGSVRACNDCGSVLTTPILFKTGTPTTPLEDIVQYEESDDRQWSAGGLAVVPMPATPSAHSLSCCSSATSLDSEIDLSAPSRAGLVFDSLCGDATAALVVQEIDDSDEQQQPLVPIPPYGSGTTLTCVKCLATTDRTNAKFCKDCGAELHKQPMLLSVACQHCGSIFDHLARFCKECGHGVEEGQSSKLTNCERCGLSGMRLGLKHCEDCARAELSERSTGSTAMTCATCEQCGREFEASRAFGHATRLCKDCVQTEQGGEPCGRGLLGDASKPCQDHTQGSNSGDQSTVCADCERCGRAFETSRQSGCVAKRCSDCVQSDSYPPEQSDPDSRTHSPTPPDQTMMRKRCEWCGQLFEASRVFGRVTKFCRTCMQADACDEDVQVNCERCARGLKGRGSRFCKDCILTERSEETKDPCEASSNSATTRVTCERCGRGFEASRALGHATRFCRDCVQTELSEQSLEGGRQSDQSMTRVDCERCKRVFEVSRIFGHVTKLCRNCVQTELSEQASQGTPGVKCELCDTIFEPLPGHQHHMMKFCKDCVQLDVDGQDSIHTEPSTQPLETQISQCAQCGEPCEPGLVVSLCMKCSESPPLPEPPAPPQPQPPPKDEEERKPQPPLRPVVRYCKECGGLCDAVTSACAKCVAVEESAKHPPVPPQATQRVKCESCGRMFDATRISVHEGICKKGKLKKRPVFNISDQRQPEEAKDKRPGGRRCSEGTLDDIKHDPPATKRESLAKVKCKHCERSYSARVVEKHIGICAVLRAKEHDKETEELAEKRKGVEAALGAARENLRRHHHSKKTPRTTSSTCLTCGYRAVNQQSLAVHVKRCRGQPAPASTSSFTVLESRLSALEARLNKVTPPSPVLEVLKQPEEELVSTVDIKKALSEAQLKVSELETRLVERQVSKKST